MVLLLLVSIVGGVIWNVSSYVDFAVTRYSTVKATSTLVPGPTGGGTGSQSNSTVPPAILAQLEAQATADEELDAAEKQLSPEVPKGKFRVAALQFVSEFGKPEQNREALGRLIREAAEKKAQIVIMPEAAVPGYMAHDLQTAWRDPVRRPNSKDGRSLVEACVAEAVPGPSTDFFGHLAAELKIHIVATFIEKAEQDGKIDYFNTAVLLGPDGAIRAHYRKLNPWPIGEATWAQAGDKGLAVVDTEFGKLGLLICYDLSCGVPEKLKAQGVTTLLYPIGWVCPNGEDWFEEMFPEKVKELGLNVVGANWALPEKAVGRADWQGHGFSRIVRADGRILARGADAGDDILYADLDLPKP